MVASVNQATGHRRGICAIADAVLTILNGFVMAPGGPVKIAIRRAWCTRNGAHLQRHRVAQPQQRVVSTLVGALFLLDRDEGRAYTITLWKDEEAARNSDMAAGGSQTLIEMGQRRHHEPVVAALRGGWRKI